MKRTSIDKLEFARFIYSIRKKNFFSTASQLDDNKFIEGVENLMRHFYGNYHGLLCDLELEKLIEKRFFCNYEDPKPRSVKKVLHVATTIYNTGGHTKVIREWLADDECSAGVVVTRQNNSEINKLGSSVLQGATCVGLGDLNHIDKAKEIARLYKAWGCDLMIVHHHYFDAVPFIVRKFLPDVAIAVYNHGDHTPWIGASLSNLTINFRDCAQKASIERRASPRVEKLPFKFNSSNVDYPKSDETVNLLSMASAYKFIPHGEHDFFTIFAEFLSKHPEVQMTIVGVDYDFFSKHTAIDCPVNLILPGQVVDPTQYIEKAHYFIEPFPLDSLLACLDSYERGAVPIPAFGHIHSIYGIGFVSIFNKLDNGANTWGKEEYIRFLELEIETHSYRMKGIEILKELGVSGGTSAWKKRLSEIYKTFELKHEKSESAVSVSSENYQFDLSWHNLTCVNQNSNFRAAMLEPKNISLKDFIQGVRHALRLKKSTGLYFPNNDFKIMFWKLFSPR